MSDRLLRVTARAFRGIRDEWIVDFPDGRSAVVLGPNATGKSTISDAVEWFFTGGLKHLAREGREQAIRNVESTRDTEVVIDTDGALSGRVTYPLPPPTAVLQASKSEVFILRGSTLAEFMDKTKGEKWRSLAEILGLEAVDQFRLDLQRSANELRATARAAAGAFIEASTAFDQRGIQADEPHILAAIQASAKKAGVAEPNSVDEVVQASWAAIFGAGSTATKLAIGLGVLATDLEAVTKYASPDQDLNKWNQTATSGRAADQRRLTFLRVGTTYLGTNPTPGKCPLCGQSVDSPALKVQVAFAITELQTAAAEMDAADAALGRIERHVDTLLRKRTSFKQRARDLGIGADEPPSQPHEIANSKANRATLDRDELLQFGTALDAWDTEILARVKAAQRAVSKAQNAELVEAGQLRELAVQWMRCREQYAQAQVSDVAATEVFEAYQTRFVAYFEDILSEITGRVGELYLELHPDEEIDQVRIEVAGDKGVEIAAHFHGHDYKPPHGLLSESHLNSLGVALFLAMAETFNRNLGFLVLDDVVNSFDADHRGRLADILTDSYDEKFQLIVLTHDRLFFQHLIRRAPRWSRLEYASWSLADGPRPARYEAGTLIARARAEATDGNADGAARTARRGFEEVLQEVCEGLEAPLPFRRGTRNDQREVGELLPGVRRVLKDKAPKRLAAITDLLAKLEADVAAVLNVESHAGTWSASPTEVSDAIIRVKTFSDAFTCSDCGARVWHVWDGQSGRCKCGKQTFP